MEGDMDHESNECKVEIKETDISFEKIYGQPWFPVSLADEIKKANCLIIPETGSKYGNEVLFPETTSEFFDYLKGNQRNDMVVDIAIDDDNYNKLELHSAVIELATIIITSVVVPVALNLISSFLYDLVKKYHRKPETTNANVNIIVETKKTKNKSKRNVTITYKGPVSGIENSLNAAIKKIEDENDD